MDALPKWVQGARRPSLLITWQQQGTTTPQELTDATLTGFIRSVTGGAAVTITGPLTVTDGAAGQFRWDFSEVDVQTAGKFIVQFAATFASEQTPAKTFRMLWEIEAALI